MQRAINRLYDPDPDATSPADMVESWDAAELLEPLINGTLRDVHPASSHVHPWAVPAAISDIQEKAVCLPTVTLCQVAEPASGDRKHLLDQHATG